MREVAIAIIYESYGMASTPPKLLMQLRDPIPTIVYPGHWGLFGGHLDPGETPEEALKRELLEEIQYDLPHHQYLGDYGDDSVRRHVFSVPLHVPMTELSLQEG
ncbi:MAG: NUDIX domain-containing protein, partial [Acaryochloridaceae cyanobacterium RL_2_7]|nr:NUDIX domain-containing protein [Acaryochloridaceae cyanobacterium RL_2_7]